MRCAYAWVAKRDSVGCFGDGDEAACVLAGGVDCRDREKSQRYDEVVKIRPCDCVLPRAEAAFRQCAKATGFDLESGIAVFILCSTRRKAELWM